MATVLALVQEVCYRIGIQAPTALYSATDNHGRQLRALLYEVAEELRNTRGFPQQKKTYTFDLEASRTEYPLPVDFWAPVLQTHWNNDTNRRLNGPVSDATFSEFLQGSGAGSSGYSYRIFGPDGNNYTAGGQFNVYPTPSSAEELSFVYYSRNLFLPKYWQPATAYTSGQYVSSNGNIYLCDTSGTSHASTAPDGVTANIADGTAQWDYQNILYETILADTDICVFDDDVMKIGLKAKFLGEKTFPAAEQARADYAQLLLSAKTRMLGSFVGSFDGRGVSGVPWPTRATDGGWTF